MLGQEQEQEIDVPKTNPMLQTEQWTREDMAVAQDWELERGNEGALLWTDLGPDLARVLCENPATLHAMSEILFVSKTWEILGATIWIGHTKFSTSWIKVANCTTYKKTRIKIGSETSSDSNISIGIRSNTITAIWSGRSRLSGIIARSRARTSSGG